MSTARENGLEALKNLNNSKENAKIKLGELESRLTLLGDCLGGNNICAPQSPINMSDAIDSVTEMRNFFKDYIDWVDELNIKINDVIESKEA